jgi:hypothetical protein
MLPTLCLQNGRGSSNRKCSASLLHLFRGTGRSFKIGPLRKHKRWLQPLKKDCNLQTVTDDIMPNEQ